MLLPMSIPFMLTIFLVSMLIMITMNELTWNNKMKKTTNKNKKEKKMIFFLSLFI
uniref:ATP synthase subunit 8 n=1 Tax=Thrips hawaiiensis TaxID=163894 RepID=A0A8A0Y6I8_9NEOP|nr:ATP synthase F0 subunit 8 [Thrips hawaiiensis]QSQ87287.1 ATP synthase subunit 8 [Thrips hawaiiensis]